MRLRIFTEPQQGATYDELLAVAAVAEEVGFDAFFRSDHYLRMGGGDPGPGPTDAWITLAGLARDTRRIRLGTLLSSATFRLPGPLAVAVAQVDAMSGGRVELGLGAGWFEAEHKAYGIAFPSTAERFGRLGEQLAIIHGIWTASSDGPFDFDGSYYSLSANTGLPKAVQRPHPPLIVGGVGPNRTPALAAAFADEYNLPFASLELFSRRQADADRACSEIGRDPRSLLRSIALVACCGSNEAEFARRSAAIGRAPDELRANGAAGTPDEVVSKLTAYSEEGAAVAYLQVLDLADLDHLRLLAEGVMARLG